MQHATRTPPSRNKAMGDLLSNMGCCCPRSPMHPPCSVPYRFCTSGATGSTAVKRPGSAASCVRPWRAVVSKLVLAPVPPSRCCVTVSRNCSARSVDMLILPDSCCTWWVLGQRQAGTQLGVKADSRGCEWVRSSATGSGGAATGAAAAAGRGILDERRRHAGASLSAAAHLLTVAVGSALVLWSEVERAMRLSSDAQAQCGAATAVDNVVNAERGPFCQGLAPPPAR